MRISDWSSDVCSSDLRGLARLHSRYWEFSARTHRSLRWVKTWRPSKGWTVGLQRRVPTGLERGAGQLPVAIMQCSSDQLVAFWTRYVGSLSRGPVTLLQGAAPVGNNYVLPDGSVGFLAWPVVRRRCWSQAVGSFPVGACPPT